jgi:hypothetical protein
MGTWKPDQSKHSRRYEWGKSRGEKDAVWRDFAARLKAVPGLSPFKHEKIGPEIHFFRQAKDPNGRPYWTSFLRFVNDGWGYWEIAWRPDEGRWRSPGLKQLPPSQALTAAAEFVAQEGI